MAASEGNGEALKLDGIEGLGMQCEQLCSVYAEAEQCSAHKPCIFGYVISSKSIVVFCSFDAVFPDSDR